MPGRRGRDSLLLYVDDPVSLPGWVSEGLFARMPVHGWSGGCWLLPVMQPASLSCSLLPAISSGCVWVWPLYEVRLAGSPMLVWVQAMAPGIWNPSAALAAPPEAHSSGSKRNKLGQHRRKNGRWTQEETQLLIELTNKVGGTWAALPAGSPSACSVPGLALARSGGKGCPALLASTPDIKSTCTSHDLGAPAPAILWHVLLCLVAWWAPSAPLKTCNGCLGQWGIGRLRTMCQQVDPGPV